MVGKDTQADPLLGILGLLPLAKAVRRAAISVRSAGKLHYPPQHETSKRVPWRRKGNGLAHTLPQRLNGILPVQRTRRSSDTY